MHPRVLELDYVLPLVLLELFRDGKFLPRALLGSRLLLFVRGGFGRRPRRARRRGLRPLSSSNRSLSPGRLAALGLVFTWTAGGEHGGGLGGGLGGLDLGFVVVVAVAVALRALLRGLSNGAFLFVVAFGADPFGDDGLGARLQLVLVVLERLVRRRGVDTNFVEEVKEVAFLNECFLPFGDLLVLLLALLIVLLLLLLLAVLVLLLKQRLLVFVSLAHEGKRHEKDPRAVLDGRVAGHSHRLPPRLHGEVVVGEAPDVPPHEESPLGVLLLHEQRPSPKSGRVLQVPLHVQAPDPALPRR
mmetsp:Transcript_2829/g.6300  ORF Transcript_2829/g.6300 Transcript_2829/m.6300 type:complete len:301 (-) Transcript_2829:3781-4683(-)